MVPELPDDIGDAELDPAVRAELRSLGPGLGDEVADHLVAAGLLIDEDPLRALAHARYARSKAPRIGATREAAGISAYAAGEYAEALAELRAARRMTGDPAGMAMIADSERALGRPERALRAVEDPGFAKLDPLDRTEVLLVMAGARRDLGQHAAALATLQRAGVDESVGPTAESVRLWYAYADTLAELGRAEQALELFTRIALLDTEDETDAAERAGTVDKPEPL